MTGNVAHAAAVNLWDDNPAVEDLLGFDAVVAPILAALRDPNLDPITIGVHAPWGGGKSSLLNLIEAAAGSDWIVVRTSPWEYEDQFDVKGTLIAEVLAKMQERIASQATLKAKLADRFEKLYRRISWSRVGLAVAKGALTMQWDADALVQAFSPQRDDTPQSLAAFRKDFAELVGELPITRVIVLVDDLDRCLPEAVVATLESIKLFLSVKRMAFVIAADQKMVESAILASLAGTGRSEEFAQRYLEKIVQLPIGMPRLSPVESEAYIGLLLARAEMTAESMTALIAHCSSRRLANQAPLLGDLEGLLVKPSEETLTLAAQLNSGLEPDKRGNPREIKRRLNAFGVRSQIAAARGLTISPAVVMKLLLLEADYDLAFKKLAGQADGERSRFLTDWEDWARGARDNPPEGIDETTRDWARSEPRLGAEELDGYITLAASLAAASLGAALNDELRGLVRKLVSDGDTARREALEDIAGRTGAELRKIASALFDEARRSGGANVGYIVQALVVIAKAQPDETNALAAEVRARLWLMIDSGAAVDLASSEVEAFVGLARGLLTDERIKPVVQEAAKIVLEGN